MNIRKRKEVSNEHAQHERRLKEIAGKLKQQYANLTDDDLLFKEGKEEEPLGGLQQKLGTTKEELRKLIAKL